jgi:hypothetical protein
MRRGNPAKGLETERTRIIELDLQGRDATEEEEPGPQYCEMHGGEMGRRKDEREPSDCFVPALWLLTEPYSLTCIKSYPLVCLGSYMRWLGAGAPMDANGCQ